MNLKISQLSFAYNASFVFENLALEVGSGEFVSLIGPSGCGKSTLFKMIGGLLQAHNGDIFLDGKSIKGERGHIGYMPQQYSLLPWYTVEENIRLTQKLNGISDHGKIQEWLARAQLEDISTCYPRELSGGMQQRVAFIRTLASNKSFLCLDEPFGALDALTRSQMYEWMISFHKMESRTILFITHSVEEAMLLSDRIYLLGHKPMTIKGEKEVPFSREERFQLRGDAAWIRLQKELLTILMK